MTEGSTDKEYQIHMQELDDGFIVFGMNGRRGSSLKIQQKTNGISVSEVEASEIYSSLLKKQLKKGYTLSESGVKFEGASDAGRVTGFSVQLLNEVSISLVDKFIDDDDWMCQQKIDGERRPLGVGDGGAFGANRLGLSTPIPENIASALLAIGGKVHLDAEAVGSCAIVFDLTSIDDSDLTCLGAQKRYERLESVISGLSEEFKASLVLLPTAFTSKDKRLLFDACKKENQEGVVFKRKDSPYTANRPASGGNQLKLKFWKYSHVIFDDLNSGKRSVPFHQFDCNGVKVSLGNVTIPPNSPIPSPGSVGIVKYLYAFKGGSLFEPVFQGLDSSVSPADCLTSSLVFKGKHVLVDFS